MANCRECGVELVVGENWYPSYAKQNSRICIECNKAYDRKWYEENKEKKAALNRQWYEEHPDYTHPLIICKECGEEKPHHSHGLCNACYERHWREQNPDHESPLIVCKECGEEKPHVAHGLCEACYTRQWKRDNPDKVRAINHRYRARKRNATIGLVDEQAIFERYNNTCIYCGSKEDLTLDHVVPLVGGGPHCEDNLVVACRSCNSSKSDTPLIEWLQTQPRARAWVM